MLKVILLGLLCLAIFFLKWKGNYIKGKIGENFVSRRLEGLDPKEYTVLSDLMLPSQGNTKTTQIDHVVVSKNGIFCVETKNYSGWIFGSANQRQWTQVMYKNKYRFYNPLFQNFAHIKALEAVIKPLFPSAVVTGFVAFPSAGKINVHGANNVGHARDIVQKIKEIKPQLLSEDDVIKILQALTAANIVDKQARKQHDLDAIALKNGISRVSGVQ